MIARVLILALLMVLVCHNNLSAQNKALKFNINEDGSHYIRATFLNQIWVRYNQNNPGTTIDGYPESETFDIGLRRTRLQLLGQLSDRVFFHTQFGTNNLSFNGMRKQGLFFHDAVVELDLAPGQFSLGAGLTGWGGPSRYASPSVGSILSLDAPLYQQATNDVNDQFLRKFSIYAHGEWSRIHYRVALSKPMSIARSSVQGTDIAPVALFSPEPPKMQYQGYFTYAFMERESHRTPYHAGTYLGAKNVLNIGGGFVYQPDAMWYSENDGQDTVRSAMALFAIDLFYDAALNSDKGTAITAYVSVGDNNYGKNYLRNIGVMNPANGINAGGTLNGAGNGAPLIGTGSSAYIQLGYLWPRGLLGEWGTLQGFVASQYSRFERLNEPMQLYEAGLHWLIDDHRAKVSLGYQNRPVYGIDNTGNTNVQQRLGMMIIQLQVAI